MSSSYGYSSATVAPVTMLKYRDIANPEWLDPADSQGTAYGNAAVYAHTEAQTAEAELAARVRQEKEQAIRETEQRIRREYEEKLALANASVTAALKSFSEQRSEYFTRVEGEVVQLALGIAAKILHREAQVDPLLVAALVRLAVEKMREGSQVTVRVHPGRAAEWRSYFAGINNLTHIEVIPDESLNDYDCLVETELGSANFGLDTQLKEIERGFLDLLALRPSKS